MTKTSSDDSLVLQQATKERSVESFDSLLMSLQHSDLRHGETNETFDSEEFVKCDTSKMSIMLFDNHNRTSEQCIDIKHEESESNTKLMKQSREFSGKCEEIGGSSKYIKNVCSSEKVWQREYLSSNCSEETIDREQIFRFNECIAGGHNNMMVTTTQFDDGNFNKN